MHVIGTAGHVDHGKSTLVERLTGIDPDRFAEEKRRGLTIDLGFAWLPLASGREIGLIDVPGHERFIKNMLAGAGGISVCLFVVAANEGWMPQSAEHLAIIDILGIRNGVVALTKSDLVDAGALEAARLEVGKQLEGSSLEGAPIVPCSAVTGAGLDELLAALDKAIAAAPLPVDGGRPRLWIDRVFTIAGAGTVVTGTLTGGSLAVGDSVEIAPEGRKARVRAIQSHKKEVTEIGPGNRVALNLVGLERQGAERGDAIVRPGQWRPTHTIDAAIRMMPAAMIGRAHELTDKGAHLLYVGSAETPARVRLIGHDALGSGENGYVQIHLRDPLALARGDRFVLRDAGRVLTFGGGEVLDPMPRATRRSDAGRLDLLARIDSSSGEEALRALVSAEGQMSVSDALARSGAAAVPVDVTAIGSLVVSAPRLADLQAAARAALGEHHVAHPLERGMSREALRAAVDLDPEAFDGLVRHLTDVVAEGAVLRLSSFAVELDPEQKRARDIVVSAIESGGFTPPLAKELGADPRLLRALVDAGELVKIGDFYLTTRHARDARDRVRARIEENGPITVAEIRDLLGTTRKYAVPLCEWLDQTGATLRRGDERLLGPNP